MQARADPETTRRPHKAPTSLQRLKQDKIPRPDLLPSQKGRRCVRTQEPKARRNGRQWEICGGRRESRGAPLPVGPEVPAPKRGGCSWNKLNLLFLNG